MNPVFYRLLFLCTFLCPVLLSAQEQDYIVHKKLYTYADGLPGNKVNCVVQDKLGFIWLGTPYGLCRFDGQHFQFFTSKSHGLQNKPIVTLYSDGYTGLVIAYQENFSDINAGYDELDVIDIRTFKVKPIDSVYTGMPFGRDKVKNLDKTRNNELTGFCFAPYDYFDFKLRTSAPAWVPDTAGVLHKKEQKIKKLVRFVTGPGLDPAAPGAIVTSDYNAQSDLNGADAILMENQELILKAGGKMFYLYKDETGYVVLHINVFGQFNIYFIGYGGDVRFLGTGKGLYGKHMFDASNRYSNSFYGLEIDSDQFISIISKEKGAIRVTGPGDSEALQRAQPLHDITDRLGNYWICTTEGLLKVHISPKYFYPLYSAAQETRPGNQAARGILVTPDFSVVSLTSHVNIRHAGKTIRIENNINHSALYHNGTLWLGSFDLATFDFATGKTVTKMRSASDEIWSMFPLPGNRILLGCTKNLDVYDCAANRAAQADHGSFPAPQLVYRMFGITQDQVCCVADNGIFIVNGEGRVTDYFGKNAKPAGNRLPFEGINDLHIDAEGTWWFATSRDGLVRWDRRNDRFGYFGVDEGFLSVKLCRIEEDRSGNLWISTDFGLAQFSKTTQRARIFTTADGLPHNEFNRSSSFKGPDGLLYFGTINGCIQFDPSALTALKQDVSYPFVITGLKKFNPASNEQLDVSAELGRNGYLELQGSSNLNISVLLLDLEDRAHLYMYEIEGLDKSKNYSYDGEINLSNLPYGTYTLKVGAQHADGTWNSTPLKIALHVLPPFYKTWWFISLVIVFLVLTLLLYFRFRIRKISKEKIRLAELVEERTKELRASLTEQTALLQEVHHRVKNNLQFIAAMLQMQIKATKDETNKAVLKETSLRINSMSLVHEMLYKKDKMEFIPINTYLDELISKLNELVYAKQFPVTFSLDIDAVKFNVNDSVALGMLTSEIISNSIKYAFAGNISPVIRISLKYHAEQECIYYSIRDNGPGIDENTKGNGLGLRLIDIFSRQMEATYKAGNDNGLTYSFEIPYKPDEQSI
ncbi:MAG: hypothetical protein FD123_2759 [Bacteroidetes bacterium]|nr:MAG: hypothetical protein FD123_2759 [Bacteroidota bacterium]